MNSQNEFRFNCIPSVRSLAMVIGTTKKKCYLNFEIELEVFAFKKDMMILFFFAIFFS
jgi:hypothetical protein